jgi:predicted metal-dependent hydrolase
MSIRVHPVKGISVTVPYLVPFAAALAFFKLRREWVIQTVERQKQHYKEVPKATPDQVHAMRLQARREWLPRLAELATRYEFVYNRVAIKHNSTNWGSCSAKNNINLNLNIVRLPEVLQDYILLHELCHLRHRNHGREFHGLLEQLLADNIKEYVAEGDALAEEFLSRSSSSKSCYPLGRLMSGSLSMYRVL